MLVYIIIFLVTLKISSYGQLSHGISFQYLVIINAIYIENNSILE